MKFLSVFNYKLRKFLKKYYIFLLSLVLPIVILEISYITRGIYPFGKYDLLIADLYHQYAPFLSELQEKFRNFSSLLYSWSGGLGTNFIPLYSYYLASPLNIILILFPKNMLTEAVLVLTLLKVGLAGGFFSIYLRGIYKKKDMAIIAFSILYALSGYVLGYSWNIIWMDVIYLLPLIILGLNKLVRDGKGILYCITLTIALISNFYMSFFLCLFTLLYYPTCYFKYNTFKPVRAFLNKSLKFTGFSLLAGGIASFLLLPTYFALQLTSAAGDTMPRNLKHAYDIFDFISRHFTGIAPTVREGMPNMYAGIVVLILIPIYFLSKNIKLKEKLLNLSLLFIIFLSLNINILDFIWHGFHYPNQVPYRYSFIYIFLLLSVSYPAFHNIREFSGKVVGIICGAVLVIIILSQKLNAVVPEPHVLYISIFFIILYAISFTIDRSHRIKISRMVLIFCLVVVLEAASSSLLNIFSVDMEESYASRNGYSSGVEVSAIRESLKDIESRDKDFYRTEITPPKTTNDPFLYNYRGLSIFSSTFQELPVKTMKNLGFHSNGINSYKYEGSTILLDSFFGIKYLIHRSLSFDEKVYKEIVANDEINVFENPYSLSLGILAPNEINDWHSNSSNPFNSQNKLYEYLSGTSDILVPLEQKQGNQINLEFRSKSTKYYNFTRKNTDRESTAKIDILVEKDQNVYIYLDISTGLAYDGWVMIGEKRIDFYSKRSTIVNLGYCKAGSRPELNLVFDESASETGRFEVFASGLDLSKFEESIDIIKENMLKIDRFKDTKITGSIDAKKDGTMILTMPYDKGWKVKVDGENVSVSTFEKFLLSFEVKAGYHNIELSYTPDKFILGMIISITSISILLFLMLFQKYKKRKSANQYRDNNYEDVGQV